MKGNEFANLTDQELLELQKKTKSNNIISAFLIGSLIGIAIYSTVKNGLGFFTFFPLFFVFILFRNKNKLNEIKAEIQSRNLK